MRKTLLTIATVGLLGLSTMSGAFAQTVADVENAAAAANTACGPGGTASDCLAAVLSFKAVLARSVGVTLTAPVVVNGVVVAPAATITRDTAVSVYNSFVTQIEARATAALPDAALIVADLNVELAATAEDIEEASAS